MKNKPLAELFRVIRYHRAAFLIGTIIPSIFGIFLAEIIISVQFKILQPILGGMTFLAVESLGALLVDFPLSVISGCIIAQKTMLLETKYGVLSGAAFLTVFILLVAILGGGLSQLTTIFDAFGLGELVRVAAQTAQQQLGFHFGIIVFMFLVSDYFLCMLGGILGFNIIKLLNQPGE